MRRSPPPSPSAAAPATRPAQRQCPGPPGARRTASAHRFGHGPANRSAAPHGRAHAAPAPGAALHAGQRAHRAAAARHPARACPLHTSPAPCLAPWRSRRRWHPAPPGAQRSAGGRAAKASLPPTRPAPVPPASMRPVQPQTRPADAAKKSKGSVRGRSCLGQKTKRLADHIRQPPFGYRTATINRVAGSPSRQRPPQRRWPGWSAPRPRRYCRPHPSAPRSCAGSSPRRRWRR